MWSILLLVPSLSASPCSVATVFAAAGPHRLPGLRGEVPVELPVGSLVRVGPACGAAGREVELLQPSWMFGAPGDPASGEIVCIDEVYLAYDRMLVLVDRRSGQPDHGLAQWGGQIRMREIDRCDAEGMGNTRGTLPVSAWPNLRVIPEDDVEGYARVRATYARLYGDDLPPVEINPYGRVTLPLPTWLTPAETEIERQREDLRTAAQIGRMIIARGPTRSTPIGEIPVYAHFIGTDPPGIDVWGEPYTLEMLLTLFSGWFDVCVGMADPRRCTVGLGDIAYHDDRRPDPLGHKDHPNGRCTDLRLFRTDLSRYQAWRNQPDERTGGFPYDPVLTLAFLKYAGANIPLGDVLFNDPAVVAEAVAAGMNVRPRPWHDDHIHLCIAEAPWLKVEEPGLPP